MAYSLRLFDLSLHIYGFPIKRARRFLAEIQQMDDNGFSDYVIERRTAIFQYHLKNNSFYKTLAKDCNPKDWATVPVMTKRDLQQPLEKRLSDGFKNSTVYVNKTSGSTGDPFVFAKDKWCHALTWAIIMDRFSWFGVDFNFSKQARFYGIPLDGKGRFKERLKDRFSKRHRFSVFDLSDEAFEVCLKKFRSSPFDYINGYTSAIVQFAKFLKLKNIVLTVICPTLKVCIVTSEMLFEDDKALIEEQFGVPVVKEYGASELDLIAFQNPNGELQLNSETLYIEVLDEDGNILPKGEEGRVVITSLYNKAHPFIRYDIGDTGVISEKSTVRKPILKKLVGRTNDIALLPSGKKAAGLTFYYVTKSIIEDDGNVKEFIIEQLSLDHFKISYVSANALSQGKMEMIKKEMENYLESGIDITFERFNKLDRSKSGKLKQFTSYINPTQ